METFVALFKELSNNIKIAIIGLLFVITFTAFSIYEFIPEFYSSKPILIQILNIFCLGTIFYILSFIACLFLCFRCGAAQPLLTNIVTPLLSILITSSAVAINRCIPFRIDIYVWVHIVGCILIAVGFAFKEK